MKKTKKIALLGIFTAIILMLAYVPFLGYISIFGVINGTTIHIPVIIGAIYLGWKEGAILGTVFGITSLLNNTFNPNATSYVFSPFYSGGNLWSIVIAILPRAMIGVVAYFVYMWLSKLLKNNKKRNELPLILAGVLGSLTNTFLVMGGIFLFFGEQYSVSKNIAFETLYSFIGGIILTAGVPEAIVAGILTLGIGKVLISRKI